MIAIGCHPRPRRLQRLASRTRTRRRHQLLRLTVHQPRLRPSVDRPRNLLCPLLPIYSSPRITTTRPSSNHQDITNTLHVRTTQTILPTYTLLPLLLPLITVTTIPIQLITRPIRPPVSLPTSPSLPLWHITRPRATATPTHNPGPSPRYRSSTPTTQPPNSATGSAAAASTAAPPTPPPGGSNLSPGKVLCNKCGLFERTHSRPRPEQFPHKRGPLATASLQRRTPPANNANPHFAPPPPNTHLPPIAPPYQYTHPSIPPLSNSNSSSGNNTNNNNSQQQERRDVHPHQHQHHPHHAPPPPPSGGGGLPGLQSWHGQHPSNGPSEGGSPHLGHNPNTAPSNNGNGHSTSNGQGNGGGGGGSGSAPHSRRPSDGGNPGGPGEGGSNGGNGGGGGSSSRLPTPPPPMRPGEQRDGGAPISSAPPSSAARETAA
ncbi:hypothetical protein CC2G_011251 [Coprinopsis cinerea AmutBmut pab1-1]|nr:hypothetical protein CC2G_011251 [Coprinopsis cinerea AmutBmut pab1-1]KAG2011101.1 hypothetical protein CC2G_011251 [Coprinopsis cinerea AmutBmut pab1-1]